METPWPLAQDWKCASSSSTVAAVQAFPSYTLLFGTCSQARKPSAEELTEAIVALEEKWAPAVADVRGELPQWRQWPPDDRERHPGCDMHWGNVKMKPCHAKWWIGGIHQVSLWCGTAIQGRGAKARAKAKAEKKGKHKGKGKGKRGKSRGGRSGGDP